MSCGSFVKLFVLLVGCRAVALNEIIDDAKEG